MPSGIIDRFLKIKIIFCQAIIKHGETIIVTFNNDGNKRGYPSNNRDKRKKDNTNHINSLPTRIAQGKSYTSFGVRQYLLQVKFIFAVFYYCFGFFAQIGKYR